INRAAVRMLGYSRKELLGKEIHPIIHHTDHHDQPYRHEDCPLNQAIKSGKPFTAVDEIFWRKDGTPIPVELSATIMKQEDKVLGAVMVFRDLTEIKKIKEQVANLSNYDLVTGVYNRRRFTEELQMTVLHSKHFGIPSTLLLLEVDSYKAINSTLGQTAADKLLIELVKLIKMGLKETDLIGFLGGSEFGIILQGPTRQQALDWAEQLLAVIKKHDFRLNGDYLNITVSIGIAHIEPEVNDAEQLLVRGEHALFQAREQGFNRTQVYYDQGMAPMEAPWGWEYRLRRALEKEQFKLQFQPIVDLQTFEVETYEALIRLIDDDGQLIQPGAFLPWAERYGLIVELDRWVLKKVLAFLGSNAKGKLKGKSLSINISGHTLADREFKRILEESMERERTIPSFLVFEITETAAVANLAEARDFVNCVTRLGPRFSLDDFGAGFSSLNYLKHLPVDYLKIDGNFIRELTSNKVDQQLVKFMVEVAKGLNKKTVAEFVENEQTVRLLQEYGVDYGQGYYFGKPEDDLLGN
ncbi:MAG: EAL domain-containing protein, partial [Clostridia bacterium]|nr:EAL domain-containing protein [Clostridia bacterium]